MIPAGADLTAGAGAAELILPSQTYPATRENYHLLTTAQSNTTQAGVRYLRSLGKNATLLGMGGRGGGGGGLSRGNRTRGCGRASTSTTTEATRHKTLVNPVSATGGKKNINHQN